MVCVVDSVDIWLDYVSGGSVSAFLPDSTNRVVEC